MLPISRNSSLEREATLFGMAQQIKQMPPGVLEMQFMALYELCLNQSDALAVAEARIRVNTHQIDAMSKSLLLLERIAANLEPKAISPP
jgi:hypothetical protein